MLRAILFASFFIGFVYVLSAQCKNGEKSKLRWDQATWLDGTLETSYGFGTNTLTIMVDGADLYPGFPNQQDDFADAGGVKTGKNALVLSNQKAGSILISLIFESTVDHLSFYLFDIDLTDQVLVRTDGSDAMLKAVAEAPTFIPNGTMAKGTGAPSDNDRSGTLHISIGSARTITLEVTRTDGNLYFGLSDIEGCTQPPPDKRPCDNSDKLLLNWQNGTSGRLEGLLEETYTFPEASHLLNARVTHHGDLDHFTETQDGRPSPAVSSRFDQSDGGLGKGYPALNLRVDPPEGSLSSEVTTKIQFSHTVEHARFSIYDVDNFTQNPIDSSDRIDQVIITGYQNGYAIMPILESIHPSPAWGRQGNIISGHALGELDAEDGHPRNTINVYFESPVDQITIAYKEKGYEDPGRPAYYNPTTRIIAISPIFFCLRKPEQQLFGNLYIDLNMNERKDKSDIALDSVPVTLTLQSDSSKHSALTDSEGYYRFEHLPAGRFEFMIDSSAIADKFFPIIPTQDSGWKPILFQIGTAAAYQFDFAFHGTHQITGLAFADVTMDGRYVHEQDLLLSDTKIDLIGPNGYVMSSFTDQEGIFRFNNLPTAEFIILTDTNSGQNGMKPGHHQLLPLARDMQFEWPLPGEGMIGDQVFLDIHANNEFDPGIDHPLTGIPVLLITENGDTVRQNTNIAGQYQMANLPFGSYELMLDMGSVPQELAITYEADLELDGYILITLAEDKPNRMDLDFALQAKKHEHKFEIIRAYQQKMPQREGDDAPLIIPGDHGGVVTTTSINPEVKIFPNPVGPLLQFNSDSTLLRYKILSPSGKIMMQKEEPGELHTYVLDVSSLSAGVYFLHCETGGASITRRFIKI